MAQSRNYSRVDRLFTVREQRTVIFGTGLFVVGLIATYLIDKGIKKTQASNYAEQIADPTKPAYFAELLWNAFERWTWYGDMTDEDTIYRVLAEVPDNRTWQKVKDAYRVGHNEELMTRMFGELNSEEQAKVLSIMKNRGLA